MDEDEIDKAVRRSVKFAREGYMSKAAKALNSKPLLDHLNPITKNFLIDMHPKAKLPIPKLPENAPHAHIKDNNDFNKFLNRIICGKGSAPSAWRAESLFHLMNDNETIQLLTFFLTDVRNCRLPNELKSYFFVGWPTCT